MWPEACGVVEVAIKGSGGVWCTFAGLRTYLYFFLIGSFKFIAIFSRSLYMKEILHDT